MWEWGTSVAEHAAAASWTSWQTVHVEPTVGDPDFDAEAGGADAEMPPANPDRGYDLVG